VAVKQLNKGEKWHILHGRPAVLAFGDEGKLEESVALWERLWERTRGVLLPDWIKLRAGTRPPVWRRFDAACLAERDEDESETAWLHRLGFLEPVELAALVASAQRLAAYNADRDPADWKSNYIPPSDEQEFVVNQGLLTSEETEILSRWRDVEFPVPSSEPLSQETFSE
jgi:hypothetical protein